MDEEIENLSIDEARRLYVEIAGASAPRNVSQKLLKRAIYWHIQCLRHSVPKSQTAIHQAGAAPRLKTV